MKIVVLGQQGGMKTTVAKEIAAFLERYDIKTDWDPHFDAGATLDDVNIRFPDLVVKIVVEDSP